jgi:hypothetical protein
MGIETALIIGALATTAATASTAASARSERKQMTNRLDAQRAEAEKAQSEIEMNQSKAGKVADAATKRRRQQGAAQTGRAGTILTGPQGLGADASSGATGTILGGIG